MARVLNINHDSIPGDAVYVGRPSLWGNPFVIGVDGTRSEVIRKYEEWVDNPEVRALIVASLKGRDLVCHCAPKACHADILLRIANENILDFS